MKMLVTDKPTIVTQIPRPSVVVISSISSGDLREKVMSGKLVATVFDDAHVGKQLRPLLKGAQQGDNINPAWLSPGDSVILVERLSQIDFLFTQIEVAI